MTNADLNRYKFNRDLVDNKHHSSVIKSQYVTYNSEQDALHVQNSINDINEGELSQEALNLLHDIDVSRQTSVDSIICEGKNYPTTMK